MSDNPFNVYPENHRHHFVHALAQRLREELAARSCADSEPPKYSRTIKGVDVDVYDILTAYHVHNPAVAHAVKKLLMPGQRGAKPFSKDIQEAIEALERALELEDE